MQNIVVGLTIAGGVGVGKVMKEMRRLRFRHIFNLGMKDSLFS